MTKVMHRAAVLAMLLSFAGLPGALSAQGAQESARARAERTLPPDVFRDVSALAQELAASGVPSEPLFNKALEGSAKRVPPARLVPAVRAYAGRRGQARGALGPQASPALIVAGADALQRGVPADVIRSLPADRPRSPVALLVLAELLESGVPADRAIAVLRQSMDQRMQDGRMLDIPARVRRMIRNGVPPREAIDRVRQAIQRDRGGLIGPGVPSGDRPFADRRLRNRLPGGE